jgi:hypothetical protein
MMLYLIQERLKSGGSAPGVKSEERPYTSINRIMQKTDSIFNPKRLRRTITRINPSTLNNMTFASPMRPQT